MDDSSRQEELNGVLESLKKSKDQIEGVRSAFIHEKANLIIKIDNSNQYLKDKDNISEQLALLHQTTQADSVSLYEDLLTSLIHEIMPYNDECKRVRLVQDIKRGKPTLNVKIETSNGIMRDIANDKGGSVQNIISIGLRFICVARTPGRNFIILDEADSGLSSEHMPNFSRTIDSLSRKTGIQVLYISHHSPEIFDGYGRVHQLKRKNSKIISSVISDYDHERSLPSDFTNEYVTSYSGSHIRYIHLENCMQHSDTLLELSPFVNYIVGNNDIGKSSIVKVFKSMIRNKCLESYIRDGSDSLRLTIGIEDNKTFEYSYKRKGSRKTYYVVRDENGNEIESSNEGDRVPNFVVDYFNFPYHKNVCANISDQLNSSFIFDNDKTSEIERAEILKFDDNSDTVQKMIARHHELVREHQLCLRTSKVELNNIKEKLSKLRVVDSIDSRISQISDLIEKEKKKKRLNEVISLLDSSSKVIDEINSINSCIKMNDPNILEIPCKKNIDNAVTLENDIAIIDNLVESIDMGKFEVEFNHSLYSTYIDYEECLMTIDTIKPILDIEPIQVTVKDTKRLSGIGSKMKSLISVISDINQVITIDLSYLDFTPKPQRNLKRIGVKINEIQQDISIGNRKITELETQVVKLDENFMGLLSKMETCPLCKQSINHKH